MDKPIKLFKTSRGQAQYFAALQLWPVSYESSFVITSYGRTHLISCGPAEAFPLVLLHAGRASSTMWFPNIAHLSEKFHVFACIFSDEELHQICHSILLLIGDQDRLNPPKAL